MTLVSVGTGAVGKGSLSHSLSIRLIAPNVWGEIEIYSSPNGDQVTGFAAKNSPILDELP